MDNNGDGIIDDLLATSTNSSTTKHKCGRKPLNLTKTERKERREYQRKARIANARETARKMAMSSIVKTTLALQEQGFTEPEILARLLANPLYQFDRNSLTQIAEDGDMKPSRVSAISGYSGGRVRRPRG